MIRSIISVRVRAWETFSIVTLGLDRSRVETLPYDFWCADPSRVAEAAG